MILRVGGLAAILVLAPVTARAGDGTFGVPPSGILLPPLPAPAKTAALVPPERAAPEKHRVIQRVQQTYSPAPAEGAGRSRVVPPSEAPEHSPIVVPPRKKQFKAPVATVDPSYGEEMSGELDAGAPQPRYAASVPASAPVMAQGAAGGKRGLFTSQTVRAPSAASAAYEEHASTRRAAPPQTMPAPPMAGGQGPASARIARNGTPCAQLRGIFTSPPECR
jgi:hypothetical protein